MRAVQAVQQPDLSMTQRAGRKGAGRWQWVSALLAQAEAPGAGPSSVACQATTADCPPTAA